MAAVVVPTARGKLLSSPVHGHDNEARAPVGARIVRCGHLDRQYQQAAHLLHRVPRLKRLDRSLLKEDMMVVTGRLRR